MSTIERYIVPPELESERLDRVLTTLIKDVSRSELTRWIHEGCVTIKGKEQLKPAERVHAHTAIEVCKPLPLASLATPDPSVQFSILYEDESILVIDKPAGLVVHPAKGNYTGTLVHGLLAHRSLAPSESSVDAQLRPGIVHRIDKDTSGILVVARTNVAREALKKDFSAHAIERVYDALCLGFLAKDITFDTEYGRHPTQRTMFTSIRVRGMSKRAITHVKVIESIAKQKVTRIECRLETGRTHQIRVHLSDAGFPLLGDQTYGKKSQDPSIESIAHTLGRQALHARVLGFHHPLTRKFMCFESVWPNDLQQAYQALSEIR